LTLSSPVDSSSPACTCSSSVITPINASTPISPRLDWPAHRRPAASFRLPALDRTSEPSVVAIFPNALVIVRDYPGFNGPRYAESPVALFGRYQGNVEPQRLARQQYRFVHIVRQGRAAHPRQL